MTEKIPYSGNEKMAFIHGYAYAKAEDLKRTDPTYKDSELNDIISELLNSLVSELTSQNIEKFEPQSVMPQLNGEPFHCECGCNVFTKINPTDYKCNACPNTYRSK